MDFAQLVEGALKVSASDIHLMEDEPPYMRVHGTISPVRAPAVSREDLIAIVEPVMPERLKSVLDERRGADFSYQHGDKARCRVVAFYERGKMRVVARLIPMEVPTVDDLRISSAIKEFATFHFGLVLVTGPTGSGKSSTLAALLDHINTTRNTCIITIEDPIEFVHRNKKSIVSQREVGDDVTDFTSGLVQAMRQDPDVILVGEMRDVETISTAIRASETGHIVLSTLHTTSAVQTIERVIGMFPENEHALLREQLSTNLRAVVSQYLVRVAEGGGRIAVQEIMICDATIGKLIFENRIADIPEHMKTGQAGMQVSDQALANLVREGKVTEEEALTRARDEFALKRYIKGVSSASDRGGIIGGFSG